MNVTESLANDVYAIKSLSDIDVKQLHLLIIDYYAASFAGFKLNHEFNSAVEKVVLNRNGTSTVFLNNIKYIAEKAAFMNAIYAHGADLDDGNKKAAGHIGAHVISSVFALAEEIGSTNEDVLLALAAGYEIYIRISSAAQPGLVARGFHSTGMAGTIACAGACAKLYHLDSLGIENAMALSTTMSGGLLSYGDSHPEIKPLNPAKAAENGIFAAKLAMQGINGPREALEGPNGWFHAVTDKVNYSYLLGKDHLLLHECYFKLYPSCRHTHCGIDAALELHAKVDPQEIKSINVYIYPNAIKLAGIEIPKNPSETKFSIKYTLSCAIIYGSYGIDDMNMTRFNKGVLEMIGKIRLIPDERMEDRQKGIRGTCVEVIKDNGEVISRTISTPKGDPENPLSDSDITKKLEECIVSDRESYNIEAFINSIENIEGLTRFINPLNSITEG